MRGLLLRLRGPLQSWGAATAGDSRTTLDFPTQTGVLGLVAGALGIRRHEVAALAALHAAYGVSVRVDAAGRRGVDYHTALEVPERGGGRKSTKTVVSRREYLHDACFTALVAPKTQTGPGAKSLAEGAGGGASCPGLNEIDEALHCPIFAPCLGRRSCVPSEPPRIGIAEGESVLEMLRAAPPPRGMESLDTAKLDYYLDGDPKAAGVERYARVLRIRDRLLGSGPRLMGERFVTQVRTAKASALALASSQDWLDQAPTSEGGEVYVPESD